MSKPAVDCTKKQAVIPCHQKPSYKNLASNGDIVEKLQAQNGIAFINTYHQYA